MKLEKKMYC